MNFTRQSLSFKKNKPNSLPSPQRLGWSAVIVHPIACTQNPVCSSPRPDQHEPLLCVFDVDLYFRGVSICFAAYDLLFAACLFFFWIFKQYFLKPSTKPGMFGLLHSTGDFWKLKILQRFLQTAVLTDFVLINAVRKFRKKINMQRTAI